MAEPQLTVRITGAIEFVSVESVITVLTNMIETLKDVEVSVSRRQRAAVDWRVVNATLNSPLSMSVASVSDAGDHSENSVAAWLAGMRDFEVGTQRIPPHFAFDTLAKTKKMVAVLSKDVSRLTFFSPTIEPVHLSQRVAATVDSLLPGPHVELGTVEGRLETLSIHEGNVFAIWDVVTGTRVEGTFPTSMLIQVKEAFGKRVSVSGRVRFNAIGEPISIGVETMFVFPNRSELPQFADIAKLNIAASHRARKA